MDFLKAFSCLKVMVSPTGSNLLNLIFAREAPLRVVAVQNGGPSFQVLLAQVWPNFQYAVARPEVSAVLAEVQDALKLAAAASSADVCREG